MTTVSTELTDAECDAFRALPLDFNGMVRAIYAAGLQAAAAETSKASLTIELLKYSLDLAIGLLAEWCVSVDENGTGWDDWDDHYKDAMYRPGPLRDMMDKAIAEERTLRSERLA